jgi:hypothetical protein
VSVAKLFAALSVMVGLYVLFWRIAVPPPWRALSFDPAFLAAHVRVSWIVLLRTLVGQTHQTAALPAVLLGAFAIFTIAARPWNAVVWLVGFVAVSAHLAATGLSEARAGYWQLVLAAYAHRYYPESSFVLVIFLAAAWHFAEGSDRPWAKASFAPRVRPFAAVGACVALLAVMNASQRNWTHLAREYGDKRELVSYRRHVERAIREMKRDRIPLVFVDGYVPRLVDAFHGWSARHSVMLKAMGVDAEFKPPGPGVYRFTTIGSVMRSR